MDFGGLGGGGDRAGEEEERDAGERDARGRDAREQGHWSWAEGLHAETVAEGRVGVQ